MYTQMCRYMVKTHLPTNGHASIDFMFQSPFSSFPFTEDNNQLILRWDKDYNPDFSNNLNNVRLKIGLQNPTEKNPANIAEFIGDNLDLKYLKDIFLTQYGAPKNHFHFPVDAMIKASIIRRIKCMRSFQKLVNRFELHPNEAKLLGFKEIKGKIHIPDRKTFWHWENKRICTELLEEAMDQSIVELRKRLKNHEITLGKRIGIDATPLEAMYNDSDAKYNEHYKIKGYKIHGATDLDNNIPLAIYITTANVNDSKIFKVLLSKLKYLGIKFEKIYADAAYDSYEHFAIVHMKYNAKFYTRLQENSIFNEKGTEEQIQHEYNKLWKKHDFVKPDQATLNDKLSLLMKYGKHQNVGAYFRNQLFEKTREYSNNETDAKNYRNSAEGLHGYLKKYLNLQKYLDYKGLRNVERHVRWTYLAIISLALARVQNGITDNLTQIAYFE